MGLRRALRLVEAAPVGPTAPGIASPWSAGQLSSIVWSDLLGAVDALPVTRAEALALPAVSRARDLLTSSVARCPLEAFRGDELVDPAPTWTYRTDGTVSPYHRMVWTVDDLLFGGWSLWAVARDADKFVIDAARIPADLWEFDTTGAVLVAGQPAGADEVLLIPGPHEGILSRNARAIRAAAALDRAYLSQARNPTPTMELHQTTGVQMERDEIGDLLNDWRTARAADGGAVAYTPEMIELKVHGEAAAQLLVDGRNAAAVDMARICSVPAALVDATNAGASLTYETTQGRNGEFLDYGVEVYLSALEARLSMDDVVPRGQRVAFDRTPLTTLAAITTGPVRQD